MKNHKSLFICISLVLMMFPSCLIQRVSPSPPATDQAPTTVPTEETSSIISIAVTPTTEIPPTATPEERPAEETAESTDTPIPTDTVIPPSSSPTYGLTADKAIEKIKKDGKITVGVRYDAPPFGKDKTWSADDVCVPSQPDPDFQPEGYDINIVKEFAKRWLGNENAVELHCVPVDLRLPTIREHIGGIFIGAYSLSKLPERCADPVVPVDPSDERVWCSTNYMLDGLGILVRTGSGIKRLCDVDGAKIVAVLSGTSAEQHFVEGATLFCTFVKPPELKLFFNDRDAAITELLSGEVAAYATNVEILKELANEHVGMLEVAPGEFGQEEFGIAVTPGETGLLELINLTIEAMKSDGTLDALIGGAFNCAIPPFDIEFNQDKVFPDWVKSNSVPPNPCPTPIPSPTDEQAPPPVVELPSSCDEIYDVKSGETLGGIARQCLGNFELWHCIADENGITDPTILKVGQQLNIPDSCD